MLFFLPSNLITDELCNQLITKLENKTDMFDYTTKEKFVEDIKTGYYAVWVNDNLTVVGEFIKYITGKTALSLTVVNRGDEVHEGWREDLIQIENEARNLGVNRVILSGRAGWKRVFPEYKLSTVKLIKDI